MTEQPDLFSAAAARADGIARADEHAAVEWKAAARKCTLWCAHMLPTFTADDVWQRLANSDASTHEPAALGPVMLACAREKLIAKTGRLVPSRLTRRHRDLTEWTRGEAFTTADIGH